MFKDCSTDDEASLPNPQTQSLQIFCHFLSFNYTSFLFKDWTDDEIEKSIPDPPIQSETQDGPESLTFHLIEGGTKRSKIKLADSDGYSYNVQLRRNTCTYWQCTVRPQRNRCKAIVIQRGDMFQQGKQEHNHPPVVGTVTAARVLASVKEKAVGDQFKPASAIVNEVK